jgi:hypothetical protein
MQMHSPCQHLMKHIYCSKTTYAYLPLLYSSQDCNGVVLQGNDTLYHCTVKRPAVHPRLVAISPGVPLGQMVHSEADLKVRLPAAWPNAIRNQSLLSCGTLTTLPSTTAWVCCLRPLFSCQPTLRCRLGSVGLLV